jgi:hypothetical protein
LFFSCNQYAEKTPPPIIFAEFLFVVRGASRPAAPGSIACCTACETSFRLCRQKNQVSQILRYLIFSEGNFPFFVAYFPYF